MWNQKLVAYQCSISRASLQKTHIPCWTLVTTKGEQTHTCLTAGGNKKNQDTKAPICCWNGSRVGRTFFQKFPKPTNAERIKKQRNSEVTFSSTTYVQSVNHSECTAGASIWMLLTAVSTQLGLPLLETTSPHE
jgi:hypothetical protein